MFSFFHATASSLIFSLSLHDALPILFTASEWPTKTGTRTQVALSLILGSRIFLVSTTIFHSSLVDPSSMKTSICGMTLKAIRSEEHTSELQSRENLVCRLLLEKKKKK